MVNDASPKASIPFQHRNEFEQFQFYFRQHWIRLVKPFLLTLAWTAAILAFGAVIFSVQLVQADQSRHGILIALLMIFTAVHISFLHRLYTYFLYVIIVTDRRVHRIKKTLFSVDDHQSVDIWTLQDIHKSQHGPIQNLFGFGSLVMETQDTELKIHFVPRIGKIYQRVSNLREGARGGK